MRREATRKMAETITLRPYQQECVDLIDSKDSGRYLISLATGLGKTVIFSHIKRNGRVLLLSHRDELVKQPEKYYEGQCSFGIEKAEITSNGEDVISASVQSLSRPGRLRRFSPDDFDTIIIDEAHHAAANNKSYMSILDYFTGAKKRIGFTATPRRGDKVRLTDVFDEILYSKDIRWGINNGYLCRIRAARIIADYTLADLKTVGGDYAAGDLEEKFGEVVLSKAIKVYTDHCRPENKHALVYCPTKNICSTLLKLLREALPENERDTVQMILGDTDPEERAAILTGFKEGAVKVIINCMVLTEGTDLPICDAIINLRPTANASLYQQIIGRGTRLCEGKDYLTIYDILPEDAESRRSICTAPTLFGIEPENVRKKDQNKFNPDEDLLDLCDTLNLECADIVKRMELHVEMMDAFLEEAQEIANVAGHSFSEAHAMVEQLYARQETTLDFGNKRVRINTSAEERYEIHPTYHSYIKISEPDMLGNVLFTAYLPDAIFGHFFDIRATMSDKEAVELVDNICMVSPQNMRYAWDNDVRQDWAFQPATPNQVGRLKRDLYFDQDITKLSASDMIDFMNQVKDAKDFVRRYSHKPKARKSTIDALAERYEQEQQEKTETADAAVLRKLKDVTQAAAKAYKAAEKKKELALTPTTDGAKRREITIKTMYCNLFPASVKQKDFVESLYSQCNDRHITFDDETYPVSDETATSAHCSLLISIFKWFKYDFTAKVASVTILTESLKEAEKKLIDTLDEDEIPDEIEVEFEYKIN